MFRYSWKRQEGFRRTNGRIVIEVVEIPFYPITEYWVWLERPDHERENVAVKTNRKKAVKIAHILAKELSLAFDNNRDIVGGY